MYLYAPITVGSIVEIKPAYWSVDGEEMDPFGGCEGTVVAIHDESNSVDVRFRCSIPYDGHNVRECNFNISRVRNTEKEWYGT